MRLARSVSVGVVVVGFCGFEDGTVSPSFFEDEDEGEFGLMDPGERFSSSLGQRSSASDGDNEVEFEVVVGLSIESCSVTHVCGTANPEVRKNSVGEAKESNADAGEAKSCFFSSWRVWESHLSSGPILPNLSCPLTSNSEVESF